MNNLRPLPFALELNPQETAAAPAPGRRRLQRRAPAPLALEQRVMFDGATVDAVVRVAAPVALAADNAPAGEGERSMVPVALAPAARSVQAEAKREVVFIEDNLPDYLKLAQGARAGAEVVVLDHTRDGLQQMIEALQGRQVDAIHLVTHGANGQVDLGSSRLSVSNVDAMAGQLARLGQSLSADGDLLLYGCDVAGGAGGDFLARLAQHTGADVAASSDTTGSRGFGNWTLEAQDGSIETAAMALDDAGWQGAMVTTVFDAKQRQLVFSGAVAEKTGSSGINDGDVMRFKNVITIDGQQIDAIVKTTLDRIKVSEFDSATRPGNTAEAATYFQPITKVSTGGSVSFQFDFVLAGTTTAVTLQNFVVNSYDIDSSGTDRPDRQFQEFKGFARYELAKSTQLTPTVRPDGAVTFEYNAAVSTNYTASLYGDAYRVQVYYDSASTLTIRSGANGYNGRTFTDADAHFSLEFKIRPWGDETTIVGSPAPILTYDRTTFKEAFANDGGIEATSLITLNNGKFAGTNGEPLDVVFSNLPSGLSATVIRTSDTTARLSFTGAANLHANANDVVDFGISFGNAAFASGNAGAVTGAARSDLVIDFEDPDTTAPLVQAGQNFSYAENRAANAVIGTVRASDAVGVKAFRFADSQSGESADGRFAIDADGTIRLTEAGTRGFSNDFELLPNGLTYAVQAGDAAGNWSVAQNVTLNVTNIDEAAPAFTSASHATVNENQKLLYTAQATDRADATDGAVRYALAEGGDAALLKIDAATGAVILAEGALDFEAKASYSFTVVAKDASGNWSEQAVTVIVANIDEAAPAFTSATRATVNENQTLLYTAQATDIIDATDGLVRYALAEGGDAALLKIDAATGAVTLAEGALDYEAKNSYSFTVVAKDATGNWSEQAATITVANIDEAAPAFKSDIHATVKENQSLLYTAQASDSIDYTDGVVRYGLAEGGDAALLKIDAATGAVTLAEGTLDYETKDSYSFTVVAKDATGNWSQRAVTVAVANIDEAAPVFTSATRASADENQKLVYTAQATDGIDRTDGKVAYTLAPGGDAALLKIDGVTGAVTLAEGALDFEAKASYSFTVIATDASGNALDQAVTVEVNNLDDHAPVFTSASSATVSENQGLLYTAQAQDSTDYTDKAVAYTLAAGGDATLLQIDGKTGAVRLAEGTLDFETKDRYSFTVVATDASGNASRQAVTIDVANIDEVAPAFTSGATATMGENQDLLYTAQAADEVDFTDHEVTYALADGGDAALLRIDGVTGAVTLASGKLDFEARPRYSFTVLASDASGNTRAQAVVVDVADLNEAPVGADASASTDEDTQLRGQLPAYQDPDGNPATYLGVTAPQHGSVEIAPDGSYTYIPARDFHGADSFTYAIDDGHGGKNTYRVDITVNPVNDAPVAGADRIRTSEDTAVNGQLPAAVDAEGDPVTYSVEAGPAKGELVLGSDGKYTYTPHANANGADSFTYRVGDGKDSTLHKVDIVIDAVNDAPVAGDAAIFTSEDKAYAGQLPGARDVDGDPVSYALEGAPAHGQVTIGPDGRYVYTPAPDFNGGDRFTYRVSDGQGGVSVHTVSITVQAVNDAPTASDAAFVTREDEAHAGKLPAATDIDRDPVTYALAEQALHGSVGIKADGSYVYTPAADYNGADRFRYTVSDGQGGSNTYTVEIDVTPVNDAPVASPVVAGAARLGEPMAPVRVAPFIDIDSTALTYGATLAGGGALPSWLAFDPATLSFTGTPPGGALGTLDIVVTGSDGQLSATTTVTIAVGNPAAPTQTATIDLMTRDTGSSANDFITADGAAGRGVSGTLDAPLGRNEVLQVSFDGGASWTEATVDGGRWQAIDGGAHDAGWTIVTRVTNTVAGLSGLETTRAVTLDRDAPAAPTVENVDTGSTTPVLRGTATLQPGETLRVEVNGQGYIVPVQDGRWTLDLATASPVAQLVEGRSYDVVATVVDSAGNSRGDAGVVRISAPVVPLQPVVIVPAAAPVAPVIAAEPAAAPAAAPVALPPLRESAVPGSVVGGDATLLSTGTGTRTASMEFASVLRGAELSDVYTRSEGFRTVVAKAEEPALLRFQGVPDQFVDSGARLSLTIPSDAFAHTQPKAIVRLAAALQDGRPLPNWVQFNGQTGQFTGEVPKGLAGELKIKLIARDLNGREAVALFRINVGEVDAKGAKDGKGAKADAAATGKPGLSERMKAAQGARAAALPGRP